MVGRYVAGVAGADSSVITSVRIAAPERFGDFAEVFCRFNGNGEEVLLFTYFADEISFTESELVGRTFAAAKDLRHAKDVAYLRG